MAVLSEAGRAKVWGEVMRKWSRERVSLGAFTKQELRAAINASDDWLNDNAASANTALPQPFRGEATASQKAAVMMFVIAERYLEES